MKLVIFFSIIFIFIICLVNCNQDPNNDIFVQEIIEDNVLLHTSYDTKKRSVRLKVENSSNTQYVERALGILNKQSCLKHSVTSIDENGAAKIKYGPFCDFDVEIENGYLIHVIYINEYCFDKNKLIRLVFLSFNLRLQIMQHIKRQKSNYVEYNHEIVWLKLPNNKYGSFDPKTKRFSIVSGKTLNIFAKPEKSVFLRNRTITQQYDISSEFLSFADVKYLNSMMCDYVFRKKQKQKCYKGGYVNPVNKKQCLCPFFYEGKDCKKLKKSSKQHLCTNQEIIPTTNLQHMVIDLEVECFHRFKALEGHKVQLIILPKPPFVYNCAYFPLIEIQNKKDKTKMGTVPCGFFVKIEIESEDESILVYNSRYGSNLFFDVAYKAVPVKK
ncbi:Hypothetical protein SRAE_2000071300 [Strongyloides ratti]|uniref:EGF-like domain-containing protein n=1 Tax=Strongyloides ratti TaxID=34506 RepID=A0A090L8C3_STRRB|nr:Hypothetical protein SRAE_2000071300 [Strongyloides ratti]CEF66041.1 Hypothetical protein SRAE_2000071300 [Strongyloides ratti]